MTVGKALPSARQDLPTLRLKIQLPQKTPLIIKNTLCVFYNLQDVVISLKALIFGLPHALPRQDNVIQEMNTLAINLGTRIANLPAANTGTSGATPGSFAQEISAWYQGNRAPDPDSKPGASTTENRQPVDAGKQKKSGASSDFPNVPAMRDFAARVEESRGTPGPFAWEVSARYQGNHAPDTDSKACASMNGKKQPTDAGKQEKTGASGDVPYVLAMRDWADKPDQSRGTPNGEASNTSDSSANGRVSDDGTACSTSPQTKCPSEIASNRSAASLPDSPGALPTAQDSAIPVPIWMNSSQSTQDLEDGVDEVIPQLEPDKTTNVGPSAAGMPTDPTVPITPSAPGVFKAPSEHAGGQPASAAKSAREGAQAEDAPIPCKPLPSGAVAPPRKADPSNDSAIAVNLSSNPQVSDQVSDKAKDPGPAASGGENTSTPGATVAAAAGWTQADGDSDSASDGSSRDAQDDSTTAAAFPLKVASLASVGPKVGPAKADTTPEIVMSPSEPVRKSSDAPNGPAASSPDLAGPAAAAPQPWDGVREHLGQIMSSAHLTEGMGQSELQVDMKSDSWGPVSVRATLSDGQFGAEIQVSNRDAHAALTEGLNGLEKTLGDKGIQVANLGVSQGLDYGHSQSQGQQGKQAGPPPNAWKGYMPHSVITTGQSTTVTIADRTEDYVSRRVSVHA